MVVTYMFEHPFSTTPISIIAKAGIPSESKQLLMLIICFVTFTLGGLVACTMHVCLLTPVYTRKPLMVVYYKETNVVYMGKKYPLVIPGAPCCHG